MSIYVFKTSVTSKDIGVINSILGTIIPKIKWNYDLEDCDNILKIESPVDIRDLVCSHLRIEGYLCEELE